jgi:hypothetical protein
VGNGTRSGKRASRAGTVGCGVGLLFSLTGACRQPCLRTALHNSRCTPVGTRHYRALARGLLLAEWFLRYITMSLPFDFRSIDKQSLFSSWDMAPFPRKSGQSTPQKAQHLVVLVHGLWGNPGHLSHVAKALRDRYSDDQLVVLACRRNLGSLTYDGKSRRHSRFLQQSSP